MKEPKLVSNVLEHIRLCPDVPAISRQETVMRCFEWDWSFFRSNFGDMIVRPMINMPKTAKFVSDYSNYEKDMRMSEFFDLVFSNPEKPCYLAYLRPTLFSDAILVHDDFSKLRPIQSYPTDTRLWIGSKNTNSGLHSDLKDNVFIQIAGRKRLWLVSPDDTSYIYPSRDNIVNSDVDLPDIDLKIYPKVKFAKFYSYTISPREIVYIPKGWWHCFISDSPSISLNHWYGSPMKDEKYIEMIIKQGPAYILRTLYDAVRYGYFNKKQVRNFFFSPPPNGARLYSYLFRDGFSKDNDPTKD